MRKLRVIVCGVGFGRYYIEAILRLPDLFELVGILSRGSKNSIKLAEKYGVPLMCSCKVFYCRRQWNRHSNAIIGKRNTCYPRTANTFRRI